MATPSDLPSSLEIFLELSQTRGPAGRTFEGLERGVQLLGPRSKVLIRTLKAL